MDPGFTFAKLAGNIFKIVLSIALFTLITSALQSSFCKQCGNGPRLVLSPLRCKLCKRHATPKNIVKNAASRAGTLLCYFKRGREDEEKKDEENANAGDS